MAIKCWQPNNVTRPNEIENTVFVVAQTIRRNSYSLKKWVHLHKCVGVRAGADAYMLTHKNIPFAKIRRCLLGSFEKYRLLGQSKCWKKKKTNKKIAHTASANEMNELYEKQNETRAETKENNNNANRETNGQQRSNLFTSHLSGFDCENITQVRQRWMK